MALTGFEDLTAELTKTELEVYVPAIVKGLKKKVGEDNAITNKKIRESLEFYRGWKIASVRMRKMIEYIRASGELFGLCSSSQGYFVAANYQEGQRTVESQLQRIAQQERTAKALDYQLKRMFNIKS